MSRPTPDGRPPSTDEVVDLGSCLSSPPDVGSGSGDFGARRRLKNRWNEEGMNGSQDAHIPVTGTLLSELCSGIIFVVRASGPSKRDSRGDAGAEGNHRLGPPDERTPPSPLMAGHGRHLAAECWKTVLPETRNICLRSRTKGGGSGVRGQLCGNQSSKPGAGDQWLPNFSGAR